ncbi:hypothetical protein [Siphonobacter sp.]|uniref:hypothetical protein n=1 Tax=Siphonobacter sp. TaxID=1869184 RepID=UPI003B3AB9A4
MKRYLLPILSICFGPTPAQSMNRAALAPGHYQNELLYCSASGTLDWLGRHQNHTLNL